MTRLAESRAIRDDLTDSRFRSALLPPAAMSPLPEDPHFLSRFVHAQEGVFEQALRELQAGQKRSHWMWFIFPQILGLGASTMAQRFAISSKAEAEAYLGHPLLGPRLQACAAALLAVQGRTAEQVMGYPDCLKLRSSMTLFGEVAPGESVYAKVLDKYFGGEKDTRTLEQLAVLERKSAAANSSGSDR